MSMKDIRVMGGIADPAPSYNNVTDACVLLWACQCLGWAVTHTMPMSLAIWPSGLHSMPGTGAQPQGRDATARGEVPHANGSRNICSCKAEKQLYSAPAMESITAKLSGCYYPKMYNPDHKLMVKIKPNKLTQRFFPSSNPEEVLLFLSTLLSGLAKFLLDCWEIFILNLF